jgi:hypothetical protein
LAGAFALEANRSGMGLAIDIDKVYDVLLADGWHRVADNSFEISKGPDIRFGGDNSVGFMFTEHVSAASAIHNGGEKTTIKGPVSSILAVRER